MLRIMGMSYYIEVQGETLSLIRIIKLLLSYEMLGVSMEFVIRLQAMLGEVMLEQALLDLIIV